MKIKEYIDKNAVCLPTELAEILLSDTNIWTNDACCGYCIIAMENAGFTEKKINEMINYLYSAFGDYTVEEAEQKWLSY